MSRLKCYKSLTVWCFMMAFAIQPISYLVDSFYQDSCISIELEVNENEKDGKEKETESKKENIVNDIIPSEFIASEESAETKNNFYYQISIKQHFPKSAFQPPEL